jgi:flagellar biosynthesis/type III secretory pathway chaperone
MRWVEDERCEQVVGFAALNRQQCAYTERNLTFTAVQPLGILVNLVTLVDAETHHLSSSLADGLVLLSTWLRWISTREWTTLATLEVKQQQECSQQRGQGDEIDASHKVRASLVREGSAL